MSKDDQKMPPMQVRLKGDVKPHCYNPNWSNMIRNTFTVQNENPGSL